MTTAPAITMPRLDNETPRAYAARVRYLTMGAERSLDKLAGHFGGRDGANNTTVENWSVKYGWRAHAAAYDQTLATLAAQAAATEYLAEARAHRERTKKVASDLYAVSTALLAQCSRAIRGQIITGMDGTVYTIPAMELTPATLATATRGLLAALDLGAHALDLDRLLPTLTSDREDA